MEASTVVFYILSGLAISGALVVALAPRIVYAAFSLLLTFFGVAGLFVLLNGDFVAIAQVFVYVGGILVLLLFGIMLTQNIYEVNLSTTRIQSLPGLAVCLVVLFTLLTLIWKTEWNVIANLPEPSPTTASIGRMLTSQYVFPFELAALILLIALIGAASIARKEKESA